MYDWAAARVGRAATERASVTVLIDRLPKCSAALAAFDAGDDIEPDDIEAAEDDPLELSPIDPDRVVYLAGLADWIDSLDPAAYAEARADIDTETLAALGLADDTELEALGLPLDYAGELPGTLDEMPERAPWSTSRKVVALGAVAIVGGVVAWRLYLRYKARKIAAWPDVVPGSLVTREAPTTRPAVGLQDMAAPMPRPWSPGDPEPEALP